MTFHHISRPPRLVAPGGPVSAAIRAMRADEPATDYTRLLTLRRAIEDRIEADIALLDALDGDTDFEDSADTEPSLCGVGVHVFRGNLPASDDDREDGDDSGIGDVGGLAEQRGRQIRRQAAIAAAEASDRRTPRLRLISGGAA